jgi:uncharacterized protein YaiE (UPF0345 family)
MFAINKYFDEKVVSVGFQGRELPSTVGIISPGEYQFDTSKHETMTVISGEMTVKLPNSDDWATYKEQQSFEIPAGAAFSVRVDMDTAYLCTYA